MGSDIMNKKSWENYKKAYKSLEYKLDRKRLQYYRDICGAPYKKESYNIGDEVTNETGLIGVVVKSEEDDLNILWQDGEFHLEPNIEKTGNFYPHMKDIINRLNRVERYDNLW